MQQADWQIFDGQKSQQLGRDSLLATATGIGGYLQLVDDWSGGGHFTSTGINFLVHN